MIKYEPFYSEYGYDDALSKIDIPDDKIINVQLTSKSVHESGWDEYETMDYTQYCAMVIYRD